MDTIKWPLFGTRFCHAQRDGPVEAHVVFDINTELVSGLMSNSMSMSLLLRARRLVLVDVDVPVGVSLSVDVTGDVGSWY